LRPNVDLEYLHRPTCGRRSFRRAKKETPEGQSVQFAARVDVSGLEPHLSELRAEIYAYDGERADGRDVGDNDDQGNDVASIWLREADRERCPGLREDDIKRSRETARSKAFPGTMSVLAELSTELCGALGRAGYMVFPPNGALSAGESVGRYYCSHDRYHLILCGAPEFIFEHREVIRMVPAEIWWVNSRTLHLVRNRSRQRQVHLVFDLLPSQILLF
jgi:Aspartyl/Asparaginyl beta-hydroxylase